MSARNKTHVPRRLGLILACGGALAIALFFTGRYVERLDDSLNGTTPLSWTFKSQSRSIPGHFRVEETMPVKNTRNEAAIPMIDRSLPAETKFALFALG